MGASIQTIGTPPSPESLHPQAKALLSLPATAPTYKDLKAIGIASSGIDTFAVYWKGAAEAKSGSQLSYIGSATDTTGPNSLATRMRQHLAIAKATNRHHHNRFDQTVSAAADGGYSLSFAALLVIPLQMGVDVIAAQIRILFAEAVISSWLDCYDITEVAALYPTMLASGDVHDSTEP